jgi:hypothetical protein
VGASVACVILVVAFAVTRSIAVEHVEGPDEQAAARAVFDAFLVDLRTSAWILGASGAVVAAAAASLIKPRPFGEPLRVAGDWYHLAYDSITEETPYSFKKVAQLTTPDDLDATCKATRGPVGAPLFLLNHWITTDPVPLPSHASKVNAYDPLLERARDCQRLRNHLPNLVAVNFYLRGELFRVVDTLNGLR